MVSRMFCRSRIASLVASFACATLLVAACVTTPPAPTPPAAIAPPPAAIPSLPASYRAVAWSELPGWSDDNANEAWPAFRVGCRALVASSARQAIWQASCAAGQAIDSQDAASVRAFFETNFIPYQVTASDGSDTGRVTGYYEPLLAGSRQKSTRFSVPLYAVPNDLLIVELADLYPELKGKRVRGRVEGRRVVPYWSRAEIDNGHALVDDRVLAYVDDPVDAFFLQIQGSGRIALEEGSVIRLGYADQNGHPYRSIGNVLI